MLMASLVVTFKYLDGMNKESAHLRKTSNLIGFEVDPIF